MPAGRAPDGAKGAGHNGPQRHPGLRHARLQGAGGQHLQHLLLEAGTVANWAEKRPPSRRPPSAAQGGDLPLLLLQLEAAGGRAQAA